MSTHAPILANSASLLLPVSNLTNLLAYHASGLSFSHFAILIALPTAGATAVEWVVLTRFFAAELSRKSESREVETTSTKLPRYPLAVLASTLVGFLLSSVLGIGPVWIAAAGAAAMTFPPCFDAQRVLAGCYKRSSRPSSCLCSDSVSSSPRRATTD